LLASGVACHSDPIVTVTEFVVPIADAQPYGVTAGADGNLWFA
jgi:streptogramin lyase